MQNREWIWINPTPAINYQLTRISIHSQLSFVFSPLRCNFLDLSQISLYDSCAESGNKHGQFGLPAPPKLAASYIISLLHTFHCSLLPYSEANEKCSHSRKPQGHTARNNSARYYFRNETNVLRTFVAYK